MTALKFLHINSFQTIQNYFEKILKILLTTKIFFVILSLNK